MCVGVNLRRDRIASGQVRTAAAALVARLQAFLEAGKNRTLEQPRGRYGKAICNRHEFPAENPRSMGIGDLRPMALLTRRLQSYVDRIVIDETGLTGNFEWTMAMPMSELAADQVGTPSGPSRIN